MILGSVARLNSTVSALTNFLSCCLLLHEFLDIIGRDHCYQVITLESKILLNVKSIFKICACAIAKILVLVPLSTSKFCFSQLFIYVFLTCHKYIWGPTSIKSKEITCQKLLKPMKLLLRIYMSTLYNRLT